MEQNEQSPETSGAGETGKNVAAKIFGDETAATENSADENEESPAITHSQATIKIEGQEFELEAQLAQDDKLLKTVLQPHFASIENANITRDVKDGKLTVTIVKKAQHKGA